LYKFDIAKGSSTSVRPLPTKDLALYYTAS
jgi:hypothetical protein